MKKKPNHYLKFLFIAFSCQAIVSCSSDKLPYEETFKNKMIANAKIEPIVEMITIEARLDSGDLKKYFTRELNDNKVADLAEAKAKLKERQKEYDQSLKYDGKRMAEVVYLQPLNEAKENYEQLQSGATDSEKYEFYYNRMKYPTVFEQLTIKYKLSKDGPLLVERYRTDIFQGDTSFYELKNGRTIADYIK